MLKRENKESENLVLCFSPSNDDDKDDFDTQMFSRKEKESNFLSLHACCQYIMRINDY